MSIEAISTPGSVASFLASQISSANPTAVQLASDRQSLSQISDHSKHGVGKSKTSTPADIKKAAAQFEAIILRQMLAPTIEPVMSGGSGGSSNAGGGAGIYGYMVTDVLATSLSKAGGLGLAKMLEKQLSPKHPAADPLSDPSSQTTKS